MSLEERAKLALSRMQGAEDLDTLGLKTDKRGNRIADYLLSDREVIVEVKTLLEDPEHKVELTLDLHRKREDYPLVFGKVALQEVLGHLPDGEEINEQIYGRVTRSIQKAFKSAEEQILATRNALGLENSMGILVILNEKLAILSPDIITAKVSEMLTRQNTDGSYVYSQIASVVVISESHVAKLSSGVTARSIFVIDGPFAERFPKAQSVTDSIMTSWAASNGTPLRMLPKEEAGGLKFLHQLSGPAVGLEGSTEGEAG